MAAQAELSQRDRLVASLIVERDTALEELRQLKEVLVPANSESSIIDYTTCLGLTYTEAKVFHLLMLRPRVDRLQIEEYVWGSERDMSTQLVSIMVHKLRRKLNPLDIAVGVEWGRGYFISPLMKDKVRSMLAAWRAAGSPVNYKRRRIGPPQQRTMTEGNNAG